MRPAERGAVTVEAAIALAALTLVLLAALGSLSAVAAAVRCQDAARELARLTARGDGRAHQAAAAIAPTGATLEVSTIGDEIRARVTAAPVDVLPVRISGSALAIREPGVLDAGISGPGALDPDPLDPGPPDPSASDPGTLDPAGFR
ncbi:TadE family type IV pilus minor pilin [Pseudonocardia sp. WMMC193]|uniref:TadE family type IV pilus minor pilin n=1 Tax=Pseudonocardia sp. WMMC193 TaxID=2911965 RepID=UPI0027DF884D|nr:TadE family type IV pilus minor pilin [Pseudonocardia sp. WMMC193]